MIEPAQYYPRGSTAEALAGDVEAALRSGGLIPGARLPTVRALAARAGVSPTTVAAAYRLLGARGLVATEGRRGTRVSRRPPLPVRPAEELPHGVRNLAEGNPDPRLLPSLEPALEAIDPAPSLYGERANIPALLDLAATELAVDGIDPAALAVVGGAGDGIERVLLAHLRPGERVALEDPGFTRVLDLVAALGLIPEPVAMDEYGMLPHELDDALRRGAAAAIITPRAQNPTGAALDEGRARQLRTVLDGHPGTLVIEDDHAGAVAGAPAFGVAAGRERWAVLRSVSKAYGPDLRLAVLAGDAATVARVEGRQMLGTGWVSHVLQGIVVALWSDPSTARLLERATSVYAARRTALVEALAEHGIPVTARSGWNVWVPVREETATVASLVAAGWGVAAGERYRLSSPPAVRVTAATLEPEDARVLAGHIARVFEPAGKTYTA